MILNGYTVEWREPEGAETPTGPLTTIRYKERKMAENDSTRQRTCRNYYVAGKTTKACPSCGQDKPLTAFPIARNRPSGRASHCKQCRSSKYKLDYGQHKIKHIRHRYGLEIDEYIALYEKQGRKCAICSCPIELNGTAHVDHCHQTKRVRGLLCHLCNKGLGNFRDNIDFLTKAITYVEHGKS